MRENKVVANVRVIKLVLRENPNPRYTEFGVVSLCPDCVMLSPFTFSYTFKDDWFLPFQKWFNENVDLFEDVYFEQIPIFEEIGMAVMFASKEDADLFYDNIERFILMAKLTIDLNN